MGSDAIQNALDRKRVAQAAALARVVALGDPWEIEKIKAQQAAAAVPVGINSDSIQNSKERRAALLWKFQPGNRAIYEFFASTPEGKKTVDSFIQSGNGNSLAELQSYTGGSLANLPQALQRYNAAHPMQSGGLGSALGAFVSSMSPIIKAAGIVGGIGALAGGSLGTMFSGAGGSATGGAAASEGMLAGGGGMANLTAAQLAAPIMSTAYSAPAIATATGLSMADAASIADKLIQSGVDPQTLASSPGLLSQVAKSVGIPDSALGSLLSTGLGMAGSYLSGSSAQDAAQTSANAQLQAAKIAADAQRLQLPNISGNMFGTNQSTYDANGRLTGVGSTASPWLSSLQTNTIGLSGAAQGAGDQLRNAGNTMMNYGNTGLAQTPEQAAAQWMQSQQDLLAPSRATQLAGVQNTLQAQGRGGLAMGGSNGQMPTNPEMAAYYNSLNNQNLGLAANATAQGRAAQTYNAGAVGTGGDLWNSSFTPVGTVLNTASSMQGLQNQPLTQSLQFGSPATAAAAAGGQLQAQGMMNAAQTMQPANAYSPWGAMLSGAGQGVANYINPTATQGSYTPQQVAGLLAAQQPKAGY